MSATDAAAQAGNAWKRWSIQKHNVVGRVSTLRYPVGIQVVDEDLTLVYVVSGGREFPMSLPAQTSARLRAGLRGGTKVSATRWLLISDSGLGCALCSMLVFWAPRVGIRRVGTWFQLMGSVDVYRAPVNAVAILLPRVVPLSTVKDYVPVYL